MLTLYQQTDPIKDATGAIVGYESKPVVFPETFPLLSGLKFDWPNNIVERNGKKYYMDRYTEISNEIPSIDRWKSIYGNTIENTYYTGMLSEHDANPSGNPTNIKRSVYKSLGVVKYILDFTYDANDNVIKIESVAPADISAGEFDDTEDDVIDDSARLPLNNLKIMPFFGYKITSDGTRQKLGVESTQNRAFVSQTQRRRPIFTDGVSVADNVSRISVNFVPRTLGVTWYAEVFGLDASGHMIYFDEMKSRYDIPNVNRDIKFICVFVQPTSTTLDKIKATQLSQYNLGLDVELSTETTLFIENTKVSALLRYVSCRKNDVLILSDVVESGLLANLEQGGNVVSVADGYEDVNTGNRYSLDAEVVMSQDLHLRVHYSGKHTLTIDNGNGTPIQKKYFYNEDITPDVPVRDGHEFMYYTNEGGDILAETFRINGDTTITAQWRTI